jgi:hypothetical protein
MDAAHQLSSAEGYQTDIHQAAMSASRCAGWSYRRLNKKAVQISTNHKSAVVLVCMACPDRTGCCNKIAEAEAAVSVNEKKWLVMHMHVQLELDDDRTGCVHVWVFVSATT